MQTFKGLAYKIARAYLQLFKAAVLQKVFF